MPSDRQIFSDDCPLGFDRLVAFGHPAYSDRHVPRHDGRVWDAPAPCSGSSTLFGYCPGSKTVSEWRPSNCACLPWPAAWEPASLAPYPPTAASRSLHGLQKARGESTAHLALITGVWLRSPSDTLPLDVDGPLEEPSAAPVHATATTGAQKCTAPCTRPRGESFGAGPPPSHVEFVLAAPGLVGL